MTGEMPTLPVDVSMLDVIHRMKAQQLRRVPIVDPVGQLVRGRPMHVEAISAPAGPEW